MQKDNPAGAPGSMLAIVLGALVLAVAAFVAARYWTGGSVAYDRIALEAPCDLRNGACEQAAVGGSVRLSISPADLPLMKPLQMSVQLRDLDADSVQVAMRGLNMDMGLNMTRLQRAGDDRWQGETILPVCSQRRMEWEAAVLVDGVNRFEVAFPFHTERP
jgi:hypothetical protein